MNHSGKQCKNTRNFGCVRFSELNQLQSAELIAGFESVFRFIAYNGLIFWEHQDSKTKVSMLPPQNQVSSDLSFCPTKLENMQKTVKRYSFKLEHHPFNLGSSKHSASMPPSSSPGTGTSRQHESRHIFVRVNPCKKSPCNEFLMQWRDQFLSS